MTETDGDDDDDDVDDDDDRLESLAWGVVVVVVVVLRERACAVIARDGGLPADAKRPEPSPCVTPGDHSRDTQG